MKDCIFCKIVNSEIPSMKVYEDDICLAYLDINPDSDGHTLIVPKKHYQDINDIPEDIFLHIYMTAKNNIMPLLKEKLECDGFTLIQNNGSIQDVKHYHLHVKPHYNSRSAIKIIKYDEILCNPEMVHKKLKEN